MSFLDDYGWILIFSIIIVFTILTMIFYSKKDKYDPEPPGRLIWAFILGIISVIPALILSIIGAFAVAGNQFLLSVLVAPVMEEIAKLWFVMWLARSDTFDGPLDGLVYGAMVGAGFAAAENLIYGWAAVSDGGFISGVTLTTVRSLTQIVGHPLYTGLAGVGVGEWKVGLESGKYNKIWRSMLFHGLWNLSSSLNSFSLVALIVVISINIYVLRKELKRTLELDKDAYERGYYDQKKKMMEMKKSGAIPPSQNRWNQSPIHQSPVQSSQPQGWSSPSQQGFGQSSSEGMQQNRISTQPDSEPAKPIDSKPVPNFCKYCGNKRLQGDRFCRNCGNQYM